MGFLDVATGSGALSIPAARRGARVLATDQSTTMLALLSRRADAEGLAIETRVMDGRAVAVCVEAITEATDFADGPALWEWLLSSNPIVEAKLAGLEPTADERRTVEWALNALVRERAGGAAATLRNPVNIGVGSVTRRVR